MSSSLNVNRVSDSGLSIKYTPCAKDEQTDEDELEEISIIDERHEGDPSLSLISKTEDDHSAIEDEMHDILDPDSEKTDIEINGPKLLPGSAISITSSPNDKTKLIGERLSSGTAVSSPVNSKITDPKSYRSRTTSRQSIFELVRVKTSRKPSREDHFNLMKKVRSSETVASKCVRKQRRKEIESRFGKKSVRSDNRFETNTQSSEHEGCNWTFVFDPSGRLSYWWSSIVSIAFIYNFWVIIYRFAFQEINAHNMSVWFAMDYLADFIYILDIAFHFRTGYLEDGVLQTDTTKLRIHYMNTTNFYIDCLCLLPLDFLYLSIGFCSILRCFRLVKVYRFWTFLDRTERHTNYPNVIRTTTLMHYLLALFHWNACLYYIVATRLENHSETWTFPKDNGDVIRQYLHALYWSTLTLTTVGNLPMPLTNGDYVFEIFEMVIGLLLFATVLGHISNIVSCISAARKDFQAKLDNVKTYMSLRRVPLRLQDRVIKWFDYLWMCNKSTDEEKTLSLLPDKLKAEIAIHVHLDTLKRVEIFQQTEAGFLCELVLRLNPVLFSPGDYICRKGEVGKEMYIVNRGRLHVVGDNGKTVLATLKPGSYFGEISILNMGTSGNRRTASVRSVGYSDLFRLSKQDLWDVLKEYPAARVKLEAIAVMRLKKTEKRPIETVDLKRSKSTPGLVESSGKVPMEAASLTRHHTLPAGLPTHSSSIDQQMFMSHEVQQDSPTEAQTSGFPAATTQPSGSQPTDHHHESTRIRTVSSVTSFLTGSPLVTSPLPVDNQAPMFHFSPPLTPGPPMQFASPYQIQHNPNIAASMCAAPGTPSYNEFIPRDMSHDYGIRAPAQFPQAYFPYTHYTQPIPSTGMTTSHTQQPMAFLSPFCASTGFVSPISPNFSHTRVGIPSASPTQSNTNSTPRRGLSQQATAEGQNPNSSSQVLSEASHDTLVQEITRLRERLKSVESENIVMAAKLNQQQWELEHRLSELEMQMTCTSDMASTGSTDDPSNPFENISRESII